MFKTKLAEKIKRHFLCSLTPPPKSCRLLNNSATCGTQATEDYIMRRMRFPRLDTKYVRLLLLHGKNDYANVPPSYFIRTQPVVFLTWDDG
jgi:hypothetical protein